ncbi:hypothetical protein IC235_10260 [Hymenobacter sp. BT664]|uniref:Carboxypeptidase regulatory-like domain-containing protein n=1 Tax=Hymenobacter montanus TaxID=2771359 RepID=A0A927BCI1_9BACT|nr:hypothetical protein [Hymenobacter montanus]MBD2768275.1 hypothetical protein [Hymenobacter montanus]
MKTSFNFPVAQLAPKQTASAPGAILRPALLGLLLTTSFTGTAAPQPQAAPQTPPVQVTQPDATSLRIRINNPSQEPARIQVVHLDNGTWILNETHSDPAYGTRLKFDNLPSGRYAVVLRVGPDRYRYTVQVESKAPGTTTIAVRETTTHRVESGLATASL